MDTGHNTGRWTLEPGCWRPESVGWTLDSEVEDWRILIHKCSCSQAAHVTHTGLYFKITVTKQCFSIEFELTFFQFSLVFVFIVCIIQDKVLHYVCTDLTRHLLCTCWTVLDEDGERPFPGLSCQPYYCR